MPASEYFISDIGYYDQQYQSVAYIEAHYPDMVEEGIVPETFFELPDLPDQFDQQNIYILFNGGQTIYPCPSSTEWSESFDVNNIYTLFSLETGRYPSPVPWIEINYNGWYADFQIKDNYCYASGFEPEPWDVEGIYAPMFFSPFFHGYPAPHRDKGATPDILPKWRRIDPPYFISGMTINVIDKNSQLAVSAKTPVIKDRDLNREEYLEYCRNYWEMKSQS